MRQCSLSRLTTAPSQGRGPPESPRAHVLQEGQRSAGSQVGGWRLGDGQAAAPGPVSALTRLVGPLLGGRPARAGSCWGVAVAPGLLWAPCPPHVALAARPRMGGAVGTSPPMPLPSSPPASSASWKRPGTSLRVRGGWASGRPAARTC